MKGGTSIFPFSMMTLYITTIVRRYVFIMNDPTTIVRRRAGVESS